MENFSMNTTSELYEVEVFQLYYTPVLVYLGTIGNVLSLIVFFKTKLRKLSSSCYLSALAISDTIFLISLLIVWMNLIYVHWFNIQGVCQIIVYLSSVCSFLSVWLVLAFTVERFVAVRYPLLRQSVCTVSRAKTIIIALVIVAMSLFSPLLLFASVEFEPEKKLNMCTIDPKWQESANVFNVVDTFITFLIPVVLIMVLNTYIGRTIWKLSSVRRKMTTGKRPHLNRMAHPGILKSRIKLNPLTHNKLTKMLLVVSTACLCLNLPSYVMRMLTYLIELKILTDIDIPLFLTIQHAFLQLFNTNFGINFALYCISGQNFRRAIKSLLCGRNFQRNTTAANTVSESRTQSTALSVTRRKRPSTFDGQELTILN